MNKNKVIQTIIIIVIFIYLIFAGENSYLVNFRDNFILVLLALSFLSVILFVILSDKTSSDDK